MVNKFQTITDGIPIYDFKLMYSYEQLAGKEKVEKDEVDYNKVLNKYTKVSEYKPADGHAWQKKIEIKNYEDLERFTRKGKNYKGEDDEEETGTNIPVIPVDLYGMSLGKIDIFSVDFFNTKKSNMNSGWNFLKWIFSTIIHILIYLTLGILLMLLLYHAINLIFINEQNPENRKKHKNALNRFAQSLGILFGIIVFMNLLINFSNVFFDIVQMKDDAGNVTDEMPIRVNVKGVYSFSTNFIGFVRFMAVSYDTGTQVAYSLVYFMLVLVNVLVSGFMLIRMICMWVLSIVGVVIAVLHATEQDSKINNKYLKLDKWAMTYFKFSMAQSLIAIIYKITLNITNFSE